MTIIFHNFALAFTKGANKSAHSPNTHHKEPQAMRKLFFLAALMPLVACQPSADEQAQSLMQRIDSLYQHHDYRETLNAIRQLRADHPKAVESRKKALKIWQEASVKITQDDIAHTDSTLQATLQQIGSEHNLYRKNMLRAKRDSLQIRYDALCGTVRVIRQRQQE